MDSKKYKERVELHCHTNKSEGYGVSKIEEILQFVKEEHMSTIAFTDYGNVLAYPLIHEYINRYYPDIKPIYGLELLVADDLLNPETVKGKILFGGLPVNYVLILVENEKGLINLYKLLSEANMQRKNGLPWLQWSLLQDFREGLLLGSTGSAGELFSSILNDCDVSVINEIAKRFDFIEVHPIGNYRHKFNKDNKKSKCSEEDVKRVNDYIISLGEELSSEVAGKF